MITIDVVDRFWSLMQSNDFKSVGEVLSDDFVLDWPQSNERIRHINPPSAPIYFACATYWV